MSEDSPKYPERRRGFAGWASIDRLLAIFAFMTSVVAGAYVVGSVESKARIQTLEREKLIQKYDSRLDSFATELNRINTEMTTALAAQTNHLHALVTSANDDIKEISIEYRSFANEGKRYTEAQGVALRRDLERMIQGFVMLRSDFQNSQIKIGAIKARVDDLARRMEYKQKSSEHGVDTATVAGGLQVP
jgi:hypothetical protein